MLRGEREYSKRLGDISPDQFQAALERLGLGDFVRAETVSSGLFGQNVFVTSTKGRFVLRGAPHYPWQFPTEQFFNDHTTDSDVRWAESIVAEAMPVFDSPYRPCVVHADFGEHNVVVRRAEGGWQVGGVFDWMTAHFGDGAADLSLSVTMYLGREPALADTFVQAYLEHKPTRSGFVELQQLYMLNLKLSFWEYWQREKGRLPQDETGTLAFEQWAGPSVTYWEKYR